MRLPRENIDLPEDRGCLQWVLGIPLVLLYGPAALACWAAVVTQPDSPYDRFREDARFLGNFSVVLCLMGLLITITPVYRRTMGRWWFAVPFLIATVAYFRAQTV
ncbi:MULTISPECIES: hypothetical protein [unclassified Streptomyces]|uniref:hypothetical protein n=1 Tax=unclassified Streptomyces TaxID=2593676 RepID=UPI002886F2EE|nr:hypothetical protein [Streptomyces sp. DSM 41633]